MKQAEVARQLGVSEDTITYWENERTKPQMQLYPKIIRFLGYNPFVKVAEVIGAQIYQYRTENGLSYKRLAKLTGFDPSSLAKWEKGLQKPQSKTAKSLNEVFNKKELSAI